MAKILNIQEVFKCKIGTKFVILGEEDGEVLVLRDSICKCLAGYENKKYLILTEYALNAKYKIVE